MTSFAELMGNPAGLSGGNSRITSSQMDRLVSAIQDDSREIWEREDTAYQRMVKDMQAAGLNPWTGISSGGSTTGSVNPSMDALTGVLSILNQNLNAQNSNRDYLVKQEKVGMQALDIMADYLSAWAGAFSKL